MGMNEKEIVSRGTKRLKIAVYGIALNAVGDLDTFLAPVLAESPDYFIIGVDTKTTDDTAAKLQMNGVEVMYITVDPWDFSQARNLVLDAIPDDIDVCISLDMDDRIQPGWRAAIEEVWKPELTMLRYPYKLSETTIMNGYRVHNRKWATWILPVHEAIAFPDVPINQVHTDKLRIEHIKHSPTDYTDMLLAALETQDATVDNGDRIRWMLYLVMREAYKFSRMEQVIEYAKKFLEATIPYSTYVAQRSECMRTMGKYFVFSENKDPGQALLWFFRACAEYPLQRENWGCLADGYAMVGDYEFALPCYMKTRNCTERQFSEEQEASYWDDKYIESRVELCRKGLAERNNQCQQPS